MNNALYLTLCKSNWFGQRQKEAVNICRYKRLYFGHYNLPIIARPLVGLWKERYTSFLEFWFWGEKYCAYVHGIVFVCVCLSGYKRPVQRKIEKRDSACL